METLETVRIDKWLWAVRIYKTRAQATEACRGGKVEIDGKNVKPSRSVKIGETVSARTHALTKTVKVLGLIDKRVGARLVPEHLEDLTPQSEYDALREKRENALWGPSFAGGRPTKKDRRALDRINE